MDRAINTIGGVILFSLLLFAIAYLSDASGLTQGRNSPFFAQSPTPTPQKTLTADKGEK